jgi:hypothetical protein
MNSIKKIEGRGFMKLKKAIKNFDTLKRKHKKGKIGDEIYERSVNDISAVSNDGDQWKVDTDGNWYKNVNGEWVKDNVNLADKKSPQTLMQLIVMILKSMLTYIPKKLIFMLIIALVTFLVHTYLVIYPNGGYVPGTNAALEKVLALKGNKGGGVAFWTILSFLIISLLRRIRNLGFKKVISGFYTGPIRVFKSTFSKSKNYLSFLMITSAILLLLAQFLIKNSAIAYLFIIAAVLAIITFKSDLSYLFIRLGYQDLLKLFKKKNGKFNDIYFDGFQLAIIVSMLLYINLPYKPVSVFLFCTLAIATLFYGKFKTSNKVTSKLLIIGIIGLNLGVFFMSRVYAHDGGVYEAGGFIPWLTSPGAFIAVILGLPPALGASIGGLIGLITSTNDFLDTFDYDDSDYTDVDVETELEMDDVQDNTEDTVENIEYDVEAEDDEYDENEEYSDGDEDEDDFDSTAKDDDYDVDEILEDLYDSVFGNPIDKVEGILGLSEVAMELSVDASDFILTSTALTTIFDGFDSVVPGWFEEGAKNTANEAWDYMGATKDLMDLADLIPKDSTVPGIMDAAGIFKDALDNMGLGDSMGYAAVKSFMSNKIKSFIFDKDVNPGLVLMDALTTILIGESEASKIISPGKTIQGGANFIIDKVTDVYNGTDDVSKRLKNGDYGGVWKVADESTELLADAVYNPNEFKKDFENVVTSDEFYDGMYDTNKALWKPKEGSWAVKRGACYIGEKTCEGFIKIADGVHMFSSWLGSKI